MTHMLCELRARYKEAAFQEQYRQTSGDRRPLFVLTVQSQILPKYGFSGDVKGVANMKMEVGLQSREDKVVWKLMVDIHKLLDLPDSAADRTLTLEFGSAAQVEREVAAVFPQAQLQLSTLEKLVGARLGKPQQPPGLELLGARLADAALLPPLSAAAIAAFGAANREAYVLMTGARRRFMLDAVTQARGVTETRKALERAAAMRLDHQAVAAKREALDLVERELPRCLQQPEVDAAPLLRSWQRDRDIEATEGSGATALFLAAGEGHVALLDALLMLRARGERLDELGRSAAHWAALRAQGPCLALLARHLDLDAPDIHGRTPRAIAKMNGLVIPS
ncbi:unnamed protein product [Effrenium voratum]|uniref:Protein C10 n=2 Tax=Effrenium voratum TaxID=2562239 RepID=A0AA36MPG4_9DINO|nr:unnamed protein product [Effrenium voratum]